MRSTAARPQLRAMSVAFDDHGEIVPGRGTHEQQLAGVVGARVARAVSQQALERVALGGASAARDVRRNASRRRRRRRRRGRAGRARAQRSLATRNGDSALRPRSERKSAIDTGMRVKPDYTPLAAAIGSAARRTQSRDAAHTPRRADRRQCCRIFARNCCARSERGLPKKSSLVASSTILPRSMKITRCADLAREAHLVRDDHHRHAFLGEPHHHVEHLVDHFRVERRRRLVEQHADRVHRQRARDRDALLLAAGELAGELVLLRDQADAVEHT